MGVAGGWGGTRVWRADTGHDGGTQKGRTIAPGPRTEANTCPVRLGEEGSGAEAETESLWFRALVSALDSVHMSCSTRGDGQGERSMRFLGIPARLGTGTQKSSEPRGSSQTLPLPPLPTPLCPPPAS